MKRKRLAIIGGGGGGSTAAWALSKVHDVALFESEPILGGHALTHTLNVEGHSVAIDLGVELFTDKQAPNLSALIDHFKIETYVAPLSFAGVYDDKEDFWTNNGVPSALWRRIREECNRFHADMHEVMHINMEGTKGVTLGKFLKERNYSDEFTFKALLPMLTTFSSCESPILDYSLVFCALSFNMGLLSFFHPTYWRKIKGGIGKYLEAIAKELGERVHVSAKVDKVLRENDKVTVFYNNGQKQEFDEVIFATHADITLSLLENPTPEERELLSKFEYTGIESVFHSDSSLLAQNLPQRMYCEFSSFNTPITNKMYGSLTRVNNQLEYYREIEKPLLVTFDPKVPINPDTIYEKKLWKIPKLRPQDMVHKLKLRTLQGKNRTWFCGTDSSFTGFEGAILSGLVIADALGADYPFANNQWAKIQYDVAKRLMGVYSYNEKISKFINDGIYWTAKFTGLDKAQISRFALELYA